MVGGRVSDIVEVDEKFLMVRVDGTGVERDEFIVFSVPNDAKHQFIQVGDKMAWGDGKMRWTRANRSFVDKPIDVVREVGSGRGQGHPMVG